MAEVVLRTTFKFRRGMYEEWTSVNPVLAEGEPGFELDTGRLKIGNGTDDYNTLKYLNADHYEIDGDDITIVKNGNRFTIKGFDEAADGAIPQKKDGALKWVEILNKGEIEDLLALKQDKLVSSDGVNKARINEDNTMEITSVSIDILDDTGANLIINGGNA